MQAETKRKASRVTCSSCSDAPTVSAAATGAKNRGCGSTPRPPASPAAWRQCGRAACGCRARAAPARAATRPSSPKVEGGQDRAPRCVPSRRRCTLPVGTGRQLLDDTTGPPAAWRAPGPARAPSRRDPPPRGPRPLHRGSPPSAGVVGTPRRTTYATGTWPSSGSSRPTTATAGDHGVGADDLLDLPGEDLLAAAVDHVVGPGVEVEEPVGVAVPEVARAQPAVRVEAVLVRAADVAVDHRRPADLDVADVELRRLQRAARPARVWRTIRSSTPTGSPTEPGRRGTDSGCAVIWLAASVMP